MDVAESTRTSELMLQFNKEINAAYVDPVFTTQVRKNNTPAQTSQLKRDTFGMGTVGLGDDGPT
jgi:hypothetical protein